MSALVLVEYPFGYREERSYIFKVIFEEFLGLSCILREVNGDQVKITLVNDPENKSVYVADILFQNPADKWLTPDTLPKRPLPVLNISVELPDAKVLDPYVPIIYGRKLAGGRWIEQTSRSIYLGLDVFGSAFFMLTRYEEIVRPQLDMHKRFPANASLAYQEGFLERPIVDEYVEILWACMKHLWPRLKRKQRTYQVFLTHDVDSPLSVVDKPWTLIIMSFIGDLVKRKNSSLAARRIRTKFSGNPNIDPHNTFEFIMNASELYGFKSAFYFKGGISSKKFDENYNLEMPWIQGLMQRIHIRGHEIGLHGSYETYRDPIKLRSEFESLLKAVEGLNIAQKKWGGRQHYLRWENPTTWQIWEDAGLDYDSTLGFADHVGFRCGTCHEFPVFNLRTRKRLRLRERPLIAMDTTLLYYMALKPAEILEKIKYLSNICRRYDGCFTILWHNTSLMSEEQKRMYLKMLESINRSHIPH
ncbi:MAG: polysaccharide deacetylase family protein [Methanothrix sp.]